MIGLQRLPPSYVATREALRTLACYVLGPARKVVDGRIGLRSVGDGIGTPVMANGVQIVVRGDRLVRGPSDALEITTVQAAADALGVEVSADPGVGSDLPPFDPTATLAVDVDAAFALGRWYAFGQAVLDALRSGDPRRTWTEAQLWPEHFDLATEVDLGGDRRANIGFSPGDGYHADPYAYVGPHDTSGLAGAYWNAPFGAVLGYADLLDAAEPVARAITFVEHGLALLDAS